MAKESANSIELLVDAIQHLALPQSLNDVVEIVLVTAREVTGAGAVGVSASIGLADVGSIEELTVDALVARADLLMYADKQLKPSRRTG